MVSALRRPTVWAGSLPALNPGPLSEGIIPAVPGEFYDYSSEFTEGKPLYVLMKCKANKARSIATAAELGGEANLVFKLNSATHADVRSIKAAHAEGLLGEIDGSLFGETWIAVTSLSPDEFYNIRSRQDVTVVVEICTLACSSRESSLELYPGAIIAMMTDGDKYGLFFVRQLTTQSIQIDACHILL